MKKIILPLISFNILFASCSKSETDLSEMLMGAHTVVIHHYGYGPDGVTGIKNFDESFTGNIEISASGNGIYLVVKVNGYVWEKHALDSKIENGDVIKYIPVSFIAGEIDPNLTLSRSSGTFKYAITRSTGHRSSDTWIAEGQL